MCVCIYVGMYVCIYIGIHVCMYYMYVCMYVCIGLEISGANANHFWGKPNCESLYQSE